MHGLMVDDRSAYENSDATFLKTGPSDGRNPVDPGSYFDLDSGHLSHWMNN